MDMIPNIDGKFSDFLSGHYHNENHIYNLFIFLYKQFGLYNIDITLHSSHIKILEAIFTNFQICCESHFYKLGYFLTSHGYLVPKCGTIESKK